MPDTYWIIYVINFRIKMMEAEEFKLIEQGEIRVRLAPAPTGYFHIGTARTALFNFLFAKKNQGAFILRIEDTDRERSKPEYEKDITESLKWLRIEWDEGPYRQSERVDIYAKYLRKLLSENKAYYCFCSEEELESERQYQLSIGQPPRYSGKCGTLSEDEAKKRSAQGQPSVIRFRTSPKKVVGFDDLIRGHLEFDASLIGDIVIAKNLSTPLYNFASVVDDFEMRISHIIRGEEHISNTPKQILIQEALSFNQPKYAHLPLILAPDRTKLSKRHGAVAVLEYRKQGYLAETLINFIAFLGWNPDTEREIYSMNSLSKEFSLEKVQKGGAVFNVKRLDYLNGFYIRQRSLEKLTELCIPYLIEAGFVEPIFETKEIMPDLTGYFGREIVQKYLVKETGEKIDFDELQKIIAIYQERLKKLSEIAELTDFFFAKKLKYAQELLRWGKMSDKELKDSLDRSEKILSRTKTEEFDKENLEKILLSEAEKFGREIGQPGGRGWLLWPLRAALTGKKASAGPFEIAGLLGKEKTLKRIKEARELLK